MKLNLSLKEKAFCLALDENSASHYCSLCVKSDRHCKLSRCSSCKLIFYCSPECQKADWCLHKQECKFIKNFNGLCDESVRLVLRLHAKSKLEHEEPAPDYAGPSRTFKDLMSHTTLTKNDEYRPWKMFFRKFATATDISDDRLKELYSKMSINCFGLNNENTAKIGLALHIRLSAINHSCRPRTRIAYVKDEAIMVPTNTASQDIELTIDQAQHSYINDMLPKEERRKLLKMKYNFDCYCDGCRDEERNQFMTGFSCERCENCVDIGAVCKSCKFKMSAEQIEMCELNNKMVEAALHSLKNASSTSVETQLAICEKMLELMDGIYYKHNVNLFTVLRNAMRCCLSLKRVVQALDYGEKLLKIQEFYQYPNDLSLLHMKLNLAKLYISQKEMKKAKAHLAPVMEVFEQVYGAESFLVNDIKKFSLIIEKYEDFMSARAAEAQD